MVKIIVSLITGNLGAIVRWIAGFIFGVITLLLSHYGFNLDADTATKLAGFVTISVAGALGEIANKLNLNGITGIQEALKTVSAQVRADGHAGETTVATAQKLADKFNDLRANLQGTQYVKPGAFNVSTAPKS